jgi:hypothetical protein
MSELIKSLFKLIYYLKKYKSNLKIMHFLKKEK